MRAMRILLICDAISKVAGASVSGAFDLFRLVVKAPDCRALMQGVALDDGLALRDVLLVTQSDAIRSDIRNRSTLLFDLCQGRLPVVRVLMSTLAHPQRVAPLSPKSSMGDGFASRAKDKLGWRCMWKSEWNEKE